MENEYPQEHNGHKYWITLKPVVGDNDRGGYHAYVSDTKPTQTNIGHPVIDANREVMFFTSPHAALLNANAVKISELGG